MLLAPAVELLLVACTAVVVAVGDGRNNSRQSSLSMRLPSRSDGNATVLMHNNRAVSYALYRPRAGCGSAASLSRRHVEEELLELRVVLDDLIPRVISDPRFRHRAPSRHAVAVRFRPEL